MHEFTRLLLLHCHRSLLMSAICQVPARVFAFNSDHVHGMFSLGESANPSSAIETAREPDAPQTTTAVISLQLSPGVLLPHV